MSAPAARPGSAPTAKRATTPTARPGSTPAARSPAALVRPDGVRLPGWLAPGAVFLVSAAASPQFAAVPPFRFRVIRVDTQVTYDGWVWLDGYILGQDGKAVEKRLIFVKYNGLRQIIVSQGKTPTYPPTAPPGE